MKLNHSSKYRLRTIAMSFVLVLSTVTGIGVTASFVGTTSSGAASTSCPVGSTLQVARGGSPNDVQCVITSTGTPVGGIKHVWLIILENKAGRWPRRRRDRAGAQPHAMRNQTEISPRR